MSLIRNKIALGCWWYGLTFAGLKPVRQISSGTTRDKHRIAHNRARRHPDSGFLADMKHPILGLNPQLDRIGAAGRNAAGSAPQRMIRSIGHGDEQHAR
jgi:hypothetical protein